MSARVLVVGAGMAGLSCAVRLHEAGREVLVLEASDGVGGRVRTDEVEGFRLDRGFQVLLTAYPEARAILDFDALQLGHFEPGALVWTGQRFHRLGDPWRRPGDAWATLRAPVGSLSDKLRMAQLRRSVQQGSLETVFTAEQTTTLDYLRRAGFSSAMIDRFFQPFLGGIFLERDLRTSSRIFEFVFRMFTQGTAALPRRGIGALSAQLAARLPAGTIRRSARVASIDEDVVSLESGERIGAREVVVATSALEAARLLGRDAPPRGRTVSCLYYRAPRPPIDEPMLMLDGTGEGLVNNLCVPSVVAPDLAPADSALISLSVIDPVEQNETVLRRRVGEQMRRWFGSQTDEWEHLRTYRIQQALPDQSPETLAAGPLGPQVGPGLFVCGDHCENGSLQAALRSGRRAAEAILERPRELSAGEAAG